MGRDPFNQDSNRSDRENWSTSKGGPVFSKLFRLDRTDPLSFEPKFPEIEVEWISPMETSVYPFLTCGDVRAYHELLQGQRYANESLAHS